MIALSHSAGMTSIAALLLLNVNRHDLVFFKIKHSSNGYEVPLIKNKSFIHH